MSESNGHTVNGVESELANLRRQIDIETARHELHALRLRGRLAESLYTGYSSTQWGELVDPLDSFRDADLRVTPLGTASRHDRRDGYNRPFVWAEIDLDFIRAQARWVSTKNPLGVGAVECLADYTVRTGYEYTPVPGRRFRRDGVAKELAAIAEDVIAEFTSLNVIGEGDCLTVWADREHESVGKAVTDGEAIIRTFDVGDGMTEARFVEPEQLRQPPGTGPEYSFGIRHAPGDVEKPVAYAVAYDLPEEWEEVPANEISHIKLNVPSCVKRGVSDYYSTADAFDGVNKLLRNLREAGAVQAAIAWIEEFDGATAGAVQSAVQSARDQNRPEFTRPFTGRSVDYQKYEPGTIQRITQGRKFIPSPSNANAGSHISVVQACLRALGARWKMPEAMISGDASNANFASSVIAGAPFVVRVECRQARFGRFFLRVIWQAIRNACKAGRFTVNGHRYTYSEVSRMIDITATPPKVAIADLAQEGVQDERDIRLGVMSLQTRRARRGLDDETERKNIKEEPPKIPGQQPQQSPFGQGQGGMGGGGEPSPFGGDAAPGALGTDAPYGSPLSLAESHLPVVPDDIIFAHPINGESTTSGILMEEMQRGVPFKGNSGRWFVVNQDGHVVPSKAPSGDGASAGKPSASTSSNASKSAVSDTTGLAGMGKNFGDAIGASLAQAFHDAYTRGSTRMGGIQEIALEAAQKIKQQSGRVLSKEELYRLVGEVQNAKQGVAKGPELYAKLNAIVEKWSKEGEQGKAAQQAPPKAAPAEQKPAEQKAEKAEKTAAPRAAVIPKEKRADFERINAETKQAIASPDHPLHTKEGRDQLRTARFAGSASVRTIVTPLSQGGHRDMARMHARAAMALRLAGMDREADAQMLAMQWHMKRASGKGQAAKPIGKQKTAVGESFTLDDGVIDLEASILEELYGEQGEDAGESLAQLREEIRSLRESIEPPERIQIEAPDGTITEAVRRDRRGHRYCVDDGTGRRRACTPNELDEKTHTHQQVTSFIEKLKAGEVTADGVVQASRMMASLSVADLRQVNKALQAKAGGSRSHRAMVDAIKERVLGVAPGGEDERKAAAAKQLDKGQTPLPAGAKPAAAKPSVPQHQSKFPPDDKMRAYDDGQRAVHDALTAATVKAMADYPVDKYRIGVNDYVNDGHESINRHLRTGKGGAQNVELAVKEIDTAIAAAPPVPNGTVAYRGMRLPAAEHAEFAKKLAVGAVFSDSGFVSTSLDPGVAAEFMHASTEGILFEMLPRRGLYVGALGMKYFGDASNAEKELLLPRNVSYRVVAVKEIDVPSVADYKAKPAKKLTRRFGKSRAPLRVKVYQMEEVVDV